MEKIRYMISDAANMIQVESHVLRYWEEELELDVPRNEMGHRYYTEENIRQFEQIKQWKEDGYQLKAIRMLLHNQNSGIQAQEVCAKGEKTEKDPVFVKAGNGTSSTPAVASEASVAKTSTEGLTRLEQFQLLMTDIVRSAIAENNRALGQAVGDQVEEKVIKEMNYLMREREEQEEERFRRLDETIRNRQRRGRKAPAKTVQKEDRHTRARLRAKSETI